MEKENWLDALNDEVREIRALTIETRKQNDLIRQELVLLKEDVKESKRKADAAWELVIMTREQIKEEMLNLKKPLWKKWFGLN